MMHPVTLNSMAKVSETYTWAQPQHRNTVCQKDYKSPKVKQVAKHRLPEGEGGRDLHVNVPKASYFIDKAI